MMKAKNYLSIGVQFSPEILSIAAATNKLLTILVGLGEFDSLFYSPTVITGQKSELTLKIDRDNLGDKVHELAEGILRAEWSEITQHKENSNPTIEYVGEEGYGVLLKYSIKDEIVFWIGCRLGSNIHQTFTLRGFSANILFDYSWYEIIFKKLVHLTNAEAGTIVMSNQSFGKFYNEMNIRYPIGWITYFSDEYEISIPDDIKEVRYEFVDGGKFLITSDEDFMRDKEAYFANRAKLTRIITELKRRVPEFVKESSPATQEIPNSE